MQTFLPYPSFSKSASCLDSRRLCKQLTEVQQILNALDNPAHGYRNHPAVRMWRGYRLALIDYGIACYLQWQKRFYSGQRGGKPIHKSGNFILGQWFANGQRLSGEIERPPWIGGPIHATHRAALRRKDPEYYRFDESIELEYYWPVGKLGVDKAGR